MLQDKPKWLKLLLVCLICLLLFTAIGFIISFFTNT